MRKPKGFLMFSRGREWVDWERMGETISSNNTLLREAVPNTCSRSIDKGNDKCNRLMSIYLDLVYLLKTLKTLLTTGVAWPILGTVCF